MTDDPTTPAGDDELVSAYLDGEATPEEAATIEASPALLARVEALRAVAAVVAAPVAPARPDVREHAIAAALAAADDAPPAVADLAAARDRHRLRVLSIAAAVLVALAIGAGLLARAGNSGSDQTTAAKTATPASGFASSSGDAAAAPAQDSALVPRESQGGAQAPGAGTATSTAAITELGDLGSFPDSGSLVNATRTQVTASRGSGASALDESATNGVPLAAACAAPGAVLYRGEALLDGEPVAVLVLGPADHQVVQVVDGSCTVVFSQPL